MLDDDRIVVVGLAMLALLGVIIALSEVIS